MYQQRLVLNGPPVAVARLADDLRSAGALAVAGPTAGPPRLVWGTQRLTALERLCVAHREVAVGVERFELLGDALQRLVVQGADVTVLERRSLVDGEQDPDGGGGVCLEEDGAPLDRKVLRAAAQYVMAAPPVGAGGPTGTALDDAVRIGTAVGRLCATVAEDGPDLGGDMAIAILAATALTLGSPGAVDAAEHAFERDWRLTQALARARGERLWARPGEADWPEWLMDLLTSAARVVEGCSACLHQPPPPFASVHTEHVPTEVEELERAALRLVTVALQMLVLFRVKLRV